MRKTLVATATLAAVAIALAVPASADPVMSGTYNVQTADTVGTTTWTATPCGSGCTNIVSSTGFSGQAHLVGGQWHLDTSGPNAWRCDDGSSHSGVQHSVWDPVMLTGTEVVTHTEAACGFAAGVDGPSHAMTLTQVGRADNNQTH
jgi:hypothetical protein